MVPYRRIKISSSLMLVLQFTAAVGLFEHGQFSRDARVKSNRLSVTENCSLVIQKVTGKDAGLYFCQQSKSGRRPVEDYKVQLSVVNMTEHEGADTVTLKCNVSTRGRCMHKVKWLFQGKAIDKGNEGLRTSQSTCSATVTFKMSHFVYPSKNYKFFKCNVTDSYSKRVHLLTFGPQNSGATKAAPGDDNSAAKPHDQWWLYIVVAVGVAALIITAVALIRWRRNKGSKTQRGESMGPSLKPAETQCGPETSQDLADPEDGISYASISYTQRTNTEGKVRGAGDVVTYSAVKAHSSSAGASADPTNLYATVN
ncbi:uncharacterized protein [Pempheris klunzingeri]|uniref:uncharacterized protein n=1 Tax=Pempheris klunzingeri TaxID=3127111 RepID=UPI00397FDB20